MLRNSTLSVATKKKRGLSHPIFILFLSLGPCLMLICFGSPLTVQQERNFQRRLWLISVQCLQYNTIQLYCLYVEKFAFWLVIYIKKTFNTANNKTSTTQENTELKTAQIQGILNNNNVHTRTHARTPTRTHPHIHTHTHTHTLTLLDFLSLRSFQRAGETPELLPPRLPLDRRCLCLRPTVTFPTP